MCQCGELLTAKCPANQLLKVHSGVRCCRKQHTSFVYLFHYFFTNYTAVRLQGVIWHFAFWESAASCLSSQQATANYINKLRDDDVTLIYLPSMQRRGTSQQNSSIRTTSDCAWMNEGTASSGKTCTTVHVTISQWTWPVPQTLPGLISPVLNVQPSSFNPINRVKLLWNKRSNSPSDKNMPETLKYPIKNYSHMGKFESH